MRPLPGQIVAFLLHGRAPVWGTHVQAMSIGSGAGRVAASFPGAEPGRNAKPTSVTSRPVRAGSGGKGQLCESGWLRRPQAGAYRFGRRTTRRVSPVPGWFVQLQHEQARDVFASRWGKPLAVTFCGDCCHAIGFCACDRSDGRLEIIRAVAPPSTYPSVPASIRSS